MAFEDLIAGIAVPSVMPKMAVVIPRVLVSTPVVSVTPAAALVSSLIGPGIRVHTYVVSFIPVLVMANCTAGDLWVGTIRLGVCIFLEWRPGMLSVGKRSWYSLHCTPLFVLAHPSTA